MVRLWLFLHLFFAFSFVGALVVADWNGRAARLTPDWAQRALLWDIIRRSTLLAGLGAFVLLGIFGNLLAHSGGISMASHWMMAVNGLWVVGGLVLLFACLPAARRLAAGAAAAAGGGEAPEYDAVLKVWRLGNVALSLLYLALLALMVFRPTP
jgi:uncharacterized membrane protein